MFSLYSLLLSKHASLSLNQNLENFNTNLCSLAETVTQLLANISNNFRPSLITQMAIEPSVYRTAVGTLREIIVYNKLHVKPIQVKKKNIRI
jgi:hypothetical protein